MGRIRPKKASKKSSATKTNAKKAERSTKEKKNASAAELKKECERIRGLMNRANAGDMAARYEIAVAVHEVKKDYGTKSVAKMAEQLGCTTVLLYKYAAVAKCWSPVTFKALSKRTTAKNVTLTFWHFAVIAKVKDDTKRAAMLEEAFTTGATSRKLDKAATKPAGVRTAGSFEQRIASAADVLLRADSEAVSDATLKELEVAIATVVEMKAKLDELARRMTARITEMKGALAPTSSLNAALRSAGAAAAE